MYDLDFETIDGIDVSHHQAIIDWQKVADDGYQFAFIKATEGVGYRDPLVEENVAGSTSQGILAGVYHFATPKHSGRYSDARQEAKYFSEQALEFIIDGNLRPVLDLEQGEEMGKAKLSQWVHDFMDTVEYFTAVQPIIYVNSNFARRYLDESITKYDLWIAHYTYDTEKPPNTGIWDDWSFWQYSDKGKVDGIKWPTDLNLFNGSLQDLKDNFVIDLSFP